MYTAHVITHVPSPWSIRALSHPARRRSPLCRDCHFRVKRCSYTEWLFSLCQGCFRESALGADSSVCVFYSVRDLFSAYSKGSRHHGQCICLYGALILVLWATYWASWYYGFYCTCVLAWCGLYRYGIPVSRWLSVTYPYVEGAAACSVARYPCWIWSFPPL